MTQPTPGRSAPVAGVVLLAAFLLATLVPVLTGFDQLPRKSIDHDRNHVPVIRTFAEAWPSPDLTDYDSATTPGMHLIMAAATRVFGDSETMLQCLSSLFGAGLILAAWWFASRTAGGTVAAWCMLPLACSPYVLGNAIWVMTDNLALATIAITVGISIFIQPSGRSGTTSAIALIASVCIRQINVWPSAVAAVVPWLAATPIRRRLPFHDALDRRFSRAAVVAGVIGMVGAFAVLGWFAWLWGGLVPPAFQPGGDGAAQHAGGLNLAVSGYSLTLLCVYAAPAMIVLLPLWKEDPVVRRWIGWGVALGTVVGVMLESAPGPDAGRVGGWLWTIAAMGPEVADRSIVIAIGAAIGGGVAGGLLGIVSRSGRSRAAWIMLGFGVSFLAAYTANLQAFQRYFDPVVLLAAGWSLSLMHGGRTDAGPVTGSRLVVAGAATAALQIVLATATLYVPLLLEHGRTP